MDNCDSKALSTHLGKLWHMKIWKDSMIHFKRCTRYYVAYRDNVSRSFFKFTSISARSERNFKGSTKWMRYYK